MINQDLSLFLIPISKEQPSGESIRYDVIYHQIQELRNASKISGGPDYRTLEQICENTLKHTTKDLHVTAILTEAWANLYGLQGLTAGLESIVELCETFWETIYPNNPSDIEVRLSAFIWINEKLSDVVLKTLVTKPKMPGMLEYTLANLIDARQLELVIQKAGLRKTEIMEQVVKEGRPTLESITKSMQLTSITFYETILSDIKLTVLAIEKLEEFLEEKFQGEAITLKGFDTHLIQIETYAEEVLEQKRSPSHYKETLNDSSNSYLVEEEHTFDNLNQLSTKKLYALLEKVAERLESIEPKSPAPKLIRKAVEWGNMSTTELLTELARHDISLSEVTKILS